MILARRAYERWWAQQDRVFQQLEPRVMERIVVPEYGELSANSWTLGSEDGEAMV